MARLRHQIPERLSPFIESLWLYEGDVQGPNLERVIPTGHTQIIVPLGDGVSRVSDDGAVWRTIPGPVIAGPRATPVFIDPSVMGTTVGVHFRPEGAAAFLPGRLDLVGGDTVALDTFWGAAAGDLWTELNEAPTGAHRFAVLERYLLARLCPEAVPSGRLRFALRAFQTSSSRRVSDVAIQSGLSSSQFIAMFRAGVGLTPKRFRRVKRVQKALALLHSRHKPNLALVALRCGYFDQAHFTRDFSLITGVAPHQYLSRRTAHQNHVSIAPA